MTNGSNPRIIPGCTVLPPMEPPNGSDRRHQTDRGQGDKANYPKAALPAPHKAAGRFAVLNAFVDFTMGALTRSEIIVWLMLYRDTRDGTVRTSQADLARRGHLGRRTVGLAIRTLERKGLLRIVHRGGLNRGPSRYVVLPLGKGEGLAQPVAP